MMVTGRCQTLCAILLAASASADCAATDRSRPERAAFHREHPCPATGKRSGTCPGYQVDHVLPLKCGGLDKPENMQWLTVDAHKAKTALEADWCRRPRVN